jgi:hypothetical protein
MSPGEFSLEVFALDRTGHLGLRVSMSGRPYGDEGAFPYSLSAGFEIDPTSLPHLVEQFRAEIEEQRAQTA